MKTRKNKAVTLVLLVIVFSKVCIAAESQFEYASDVIAEGKLNKKIINSFILYPNDILIGDYLITDEAISGRKCIIEPKSGKYIIPSSVMDIVITSDFIRGRVDAKDDVDKKWNLGPVVYFSLDVKKKKVTWYKDREMRQALGEIWNPK